MITPIEQIASIVPEARSAEKVNASGEQGAFGDIFRSAIENVRQTDAEKTQAQYLLATGQLDNPAALTIALCRFSEYFSGEGIGMYVENEALRFFPLAVSNEWGEWYWAIFVLEGLAALAIMACLLRQRARRPGA